MSLRTAPRTVATLDIGHTEPGTISQNWLHIINNGLGEPVRVPILVGRGRHDGPVLGLTAAVHGDELNGIPVIQRLFGALDLADLRGTVVGVLAMNVPGLLLGQRVFNDGEDLNHLAPGKPNGTESQVYLHRLLDRIVSRFTHLIDLHTASAGRVNSFYVRADMDHPVASRMARLHNPQIIVRNPPNDATVRGAAAALGIPAITCELRDPSRFQDDVVDAGLQGIRNVMGDLGMQDTEVFRPLLDTVVCEGSYWLYTDEGGILEVLPEVTDFVEKDQVVADVRTIFGEVTRRYVAPEAGVVIGRSVNPINQTGSRILHLGRNPQRIPSLLEEDILRAARTKP